MGAVLGKKLASLGRDRQVVCITHLATLAACGNDHWTVTKEVSQQRTRTVVHRLTDAERVTEIARLVGSPSGGDQSLGVRHAQEMLKSSHQKISKR